MRMRNFIGINVSISTDYMTDSDILSINFLKWHCIEILATVYLSWFRLDL